ncbi:helix-turn-helix domain-containing protein [Enterococcus sp. AZ163]|uniref:helix-turn-helix transcriptional regulator n=1 Tax=Enterococcus sp. AZ163 TaxID=2774638 RepID=UPI003D2B30A1
MKGKYQIHHMKKNYPVKVIPHNIFLEKGRTHDSLSLHWHRSLEFVLILGDPMIIWKEGTKHQLKHGDLLMINSEESHEFLLENNGNYQGVTLIVSYEFLKKQIPQLDHYMFSLEKADERTDQFTELLVSLRDIYLSEDPWTTFLLQSKASEIMYLLFSHCLQEHQISTQQSKYAQRYKTVIGYINAHFTEPITLAEAAATVHLNPEFFSRNFKSYIGISFKDYLKKVRLNKAIRELLTTEKNLTEIAYTSGFADHKAFINAFKTAYAATPSQYRRQFKSTKSKKEY